MTYENYRDKAADKVSEKITPFVSERLSNFDAATIKEFISDGTKTTFDLAAGEKSFDEVKTFAKEKTRSKVADEVAERVAPHVSRELVKFSDAALERSFKVSYELAEISLPPKISKDLTHELRVSSNRLKKENKDNLEAAAVEIVSSSTKTLFDFATGEKNFEETSRAIVAQGKVVVKNVVIEKGKEVAVQEAQRVGRKVVGNAAQNILLKAGVNSNVAVKALVLGNMIKDNVLDLLDGKIDEEQFVKEVSKKGLMLAVETVGGYIGANSGAIIGQTLIPIPVVGAVIGSTVTAVACQGLIVAVDGVMKLWDASKINAAADRRKVISKIKEEALVEMNRQRGVMEKYFAEEKYKWDKNVRDGFELIGKGAYSNDVEVIATGLDKILQNFGGEVAFNNREEFRRDFRRRKIVVNL